MHTYPRTKQLKKKAFRINSQKIKQAIGIQLTFISESKLQKEHLLAKYDCFFRDLFFHFELLLICECATKKELKMNAFNKKENRKQAIGIQ